MKNLKTLAFSLYKKTNFSGVDKVKIKLTRKPTQKKFKIQKPDPFSKSFISDSLTTYYATFSSCSKK